MRTKVISFDLQGTLTDSTFSDTFWKRTLAELLSEKKCISLADAQKQLVELFAKTGKYNHRYYSVSYWMERYGTTFRQILPRLGQPILFEDTMKIIQELQGNVRVVIFTSTTHEFIDIEAGKAAQYVERTFSSLDDFRIAGKPPKAYIALANEIGVKPEEILHIGDSEEMDVDNAMKAGCDAFYFDHTKPREEMIARLLEKIEAIGAIAKKPIFKKPI